MIKGRFGRCRHPVRHADRLVGLLQHQYSYIEALATHPLAGLHVVWSCHDSCVNNDVAADVAYLDRSAKLAVASSI